MKRQIVYMSILILLLSFLLSGCHAESPASDAVSTEQTEQIEQKEQSKKVVYPRNIIHIGDSFEYYPTPGEGHFLCMVDNVWVVDRASQCPVESKFVIPILEAYAEGEDKRRIYWYDEWFTEGGPFDRGAQIVMVDITVTNVDAVAKLHNGTLTDTGLFYEPDVFSAYDIFELTDLSRYEGTGSKLCYYGTDSSYFSRMGEYSEDILETPGTESAAIQLPPGESIQYTLGYMVHGEPGGTVADLSVRWLYVKGTGWADGHADTGIFIDTELGDE